ncbi:hypothetical protein FIU87_01170 [Bacillus sp. THAF10]|nr:hypothetical protein FIU87_01170 [Bacillus sp. THAF10]
MYARYYQPETGRFISQDSYKGEAHDPWTQHLYTYTMNSPTNFIDPTGHVAHFMAGPGGGPTSYINKDTIDKGSTKQPAAKTDNKKKKSSVKSWIQTGLDYLGFAPAIGTVADGINALIYLSDGDYTNAGINAIAMVPFWGDAAKGAKMLAKGSKWSSDKAVYSVAYEVNLPKDMYPNLSSPRHFQNANEQLYNAFQKDSKFAQPMEGLYPGINKGVQPGSRGKFSRNAPTKEVTWHHYADREGVLQLVPRNQHQAKGPIQQILHPGGRGGMENWGGGR